MLRDLKSSNYLILQSHILYKYKNTIIPFKIKDKLPYISKGHVKQAISKNKQNTSFCLIFLKHF